MADTNFGFLKQFPRYAVFADACIDAEAAFASSPSVCVMATRKAMELAVKWVYAIDSNMGKPWNNKLAALLDGSRFKKAVEDPTWQQLELIRKVGNNATHTDRRITPQSAVVALRALFNFIEWIDFHYGPDYQKRKFDVRAIPAIKRSIDVKAYRKSQEENAKKDSTIAELERQLRELRDQFAATKDNRTEEAPFQPDEIPEAETRKCYIDVDLEYTGWTLGDDVRTEVEVSGMPNKTGIGRVDYVLYGRDAKPLAIIEAKRTMYDPKKGETQAKLYADCLERKYGYRPFIFLSNGFETYFLEDGSVPTRRCSGVFSQDDLQRLMNRRGHTTPLSQMAVDKQICGGGGRYYQIEAVKAVCQHMEEGYRRSLVVMATGTGKTRTAAGLIDLLMRANVVTNVLFLADRRELVNQAKNAFQKHLPSASVCNLCTLSGKKEAADSRIVFSTYPTILNAIDDVKNDDGKRLFSPAHFDLIVVDEAHRSIFKKYREIFDYFDSHVLGLTATPKNEVDRNTYDFFEVEQGIPTYLYEYETAVEKDHFLVPFYSIETKTSFLSDGIHYDELSEEEQDRYDDDWAEAKGTEAPDFTPSEAVNRFVFNDKTIDLVLETLMEDGIKVKGGAELGKTIIFAQNRKHADLIVERFSKLYPKEAAKGYCKRVIYTDDYAPSVITDFETKEMPVITVSVNMMDTGIDVPEVVNLVFFKQVHSKVQFWQMIGRGTRLCPGLGVLDRTGEHNDKQCFYIFDWCNNFEFFRANPNIAEGKAPESLPERIFKRQALVVKGLQDAAYADDEHQSLRKRLVSQMSDQVKEIRQPLSATVKQHLREIDRFSQEQNYQSLTDIDVADLNKIAALVRPYCDDEYALRFDSIMYGFMTALLTGDDANPFRKKLVDTAVKLQHKTSIPQVRAKLTLLQRICAEGYLTNIGIPALEDIRTEIRELAKFLKDEGAGRAVVTSLSDPIISRTEGQSLELSEDYEDYKRKVQHYLKEHMDRPVIAKLHSNLPLTAGDFDELNKIFTQELGNAQDYENTYHDESFGRLVREIVGVDHEAAMQAFGEFLNDNSLNRDQMDFVAKVVDYVERNGYLELKNLSLPPFDRPASLQKLFDAAQQHRLVDLIRTLDDRADKLAA